MVIGDGIKMELTTVLLINSVLAALTAILATIRFFGRPNGMPKRARWLIGCIAIAFWYLFALDAFALTWGYGWTLSPIVRSTPVRAICLLGMVIVQCPFFFRGIDGIR